MVDVINSTIFQTQLDKDKLRTIENAEKWPRKGVFHPL
jgi:hypothetical protein